MLTICIPTYNFNIVSLISELSDQASLLNCNIEIIVIDDASKTECKIDNRKVSTFNNVQYIELTENIGRSKIRNLFTSYAKNDWLLFLDCDAIIISKSFIPNYIELLKQTSYKVICGGRIYSKKAIERTNRLRWKYGIVKESQSIEMRKKFPNKSFMTNNFALHKSVFDVVKFDERIAQYGHEDTLLGFELKINNIQVFHFDNAVLNGDIETNSEFLNKTEKGLINLVSILQYIDYNPQFIEDVTILRFYYKLKKFKLHILLNIVFSLVKPVIYFFLARGYVNLCLFDFYKIGFFSINLNMSKKLSNH